MTTRVGPCLCGDTLCPWCGNGDDAADQSDAGLDAIFAAPAPAADFDPDDDPPALAKVGSSSIFDAGKTWGLTGPPLVLSAPAMVVDLCADRPHPPTVARLVEAGHADVDDRIVDPGTWIVAPGDLPEGTALTMNAGDFALRFRPYDLRSKPPAGMLIVEVLVRTPSGPATSSGFFVPAAAGAATLGDAGRIVFEVVAAAGKEVGP